jgi:hypothetical protein
MRSRPQPVSLLDDIAQRVSAEILAGVGRWCEGALAGADTSQRSTRAQRTRAHNDTASTTAPGAPAISPSLAPTAGPPATAHAAAAKRPSTNDLLDRVRADLHDAYDGRPVSPDRLAFRLKLDRDLVDAALTLLVRKREARLTKQRGRISYLPVVLPAK